MSKKESFSIKVSDLTGGWFSAVGELDLNVDIRDAAIKNLADIIKNKYGLTSESAAYEMSCGTIKIKPRGRKFLVQRTIHSF